MATKLYDLAVSTGSWTSNDGKEHKNWLNVGRVMKSDKGTSYILLNTSFNPAGVPHKDGDDCITIALFPPKDKQQDNPKQNYRKQNTLSDNSGYDHLVDNMPF